MSQTLSSAFPETGSAAGPDRSRGRPLVERIAGWSTRHRKTAVFGWLILVAVLFAVGHSLGSTSAPSYDAGQAGQAEQTLHRLTGQTNTAPVESVLVQGPKASTDAAAAKAVIAALRTVPQAATDIAAPKYAGGGGSVLVTFSVPGNPDNASTTVQPAQKAVAAVQARYPGMTVAETGDASISGALNTVLDHDFQKAETTSVPVTIVLLLIAFGSLIAAGIPLLLAVTSVMAALSLLSVVGQWLPVSSSTSEVVLIIGMAVGVDYSLFYLRREREERARGRSHAEALRIAAGTSGKSILISGLTVMIAVAGLFITGLSIFDGVALGSIAVVGIAVTGSLTVLPALLSWLGPRAERGRIPLLRRRAVAKDSKLWAAVVGGVAKRPLLLGGAAAIALLALASPALGMKIGYPAIDAPRGLPVAVTMQKVQQAFPSGPAPAEVVVTGSGLTSPAVTRAVSGLHGEETVLAGGRGLLVSVPMAGTNQALLTLEDKTLPDTLGKVPGVSYSVTGDQASIYDFVQQLRSRVPLVFAAVAVAAFVLLAISFGSLAVSLISILLNLLSVAASYGLITLIFQDGRLQGPLDYTSFGGIIAWEPLFMFVFLFGISMDYHVFLLSRIRELRLRGLSTRDAVTGGVASSAGVVTSAAFIMVAVFAVFATLSLIDMKILGIGMAAAVLIDATVVRGVLLPAALSLVGDRLWSRRRHIEAPY
jgi:putative drug exporter of the RND superfamily